MRATDDQIQRVQALRQRMATNAAIRAAESYAVPTQTFDELANVRAVAAVLGELLALREADVLMFDCIECRAPFAPDDADHVVCDDCTRKTMAHVADGGSLVPRQQPARDPRRDVWAMTQGEGRAKACSYCGGTGEEAGSSLHGPCGWCNGSGVASGGAK